MFNDFHGKAVLITGGTKGIGLAIGKAFAGHGAHCYLTHRWGSANEDDIKKQFAELGAPEPTIVEADVSHDEATGELLDLIKKDHDRVEVFISNVCVVEVADGPDSYRRRTLLKSLEYSAWPLVAYPLEMKKRMGQYPRYIVGVSSDGPDNYFSGYEYVALSKATMETLTRYFAKRLLDEEADTNINIVRSRNVPTQAVYEIFGQSYIDHMARWAGEEYFVQVEDVANATLALCSGLLDAMNGQVIQVDKGAAFSDTLMRLREHLEAHPELRPRGVE